MASDDVLVWSPRLAGVEESQALAQHIIEFLARQRSSSFVAEAEEMYMADPRCLFRKWVDKYNSGPVEATPKQLYEALAMLVAAMMSQTGQDYVAVMESRLRLGKKRKIAWTDIGKCLGKPTKARRVQMATKQIATKQQKIVNKPSAKTAAAKWH